LTDGGVRTNEISSPVAERNAHTQHGGPKETSADASATRPVSDPLLALDHRLHAAEGRMTSGLSPTGQWLAFLDWAAHMANTPFRSASLASSAMAQWQRLGRAMLGQTEIAPPPGDHRFGDPAWQTMPFQQIAQAFLLGEEWWAPRCG
jgi:poly[(R)-3-hydroxyalkanoate] polymerase subunit PhaC